MKTSFPGSSVGKKSTCNAEDPSSIPGSGRSTGEGIGYPLQYSWVSLMVQLVKNSPENVGDLGLIPGWGRFPWRRDKLPTPVFWPGKFHGLHSPWGHKESVTNERLSHSGAPAGQSSVACGIFRHAKQPSTDVETSCPGSL